MLNKKVGLIVLLLGLVAGNTFAGTLTNYAVGDVLLCFRYTNGVNDLIVDAGPVSTLINATINQRIPITQYAGNQLALVGTNGAIWSAFTYYDDSVSPASAQWTLFISKPRTSLYTKTSAWQEAPAAAQQTTAGDMASVALGASVNLGFNALNTPASVVEPDDTSGNSPNYLRGQSYDYVMGGPNQANGYTFNGDWFGDPEISAPPTFTRSGKVIRSDFYQVPPSDTGGAPVKFLGFFEFNTNGAMTYVAYPTLPAVTTLAASAVTATSAQLNATVNPNAASTTLFFQYGQTTSYGSTSGTNIIGITSGTYGLSVSNLTAGMTYHFRAAAYNQAGTNYGSDLTFTTAGGGVVVAPVITAFSRSNGVAYVSFTTGNTGTYTLRGTNSAGLGAARTNWPAIASVGGNGFTNTLQDAVADPNKFYLISAQ